MHIPGRRDKYEKGLPWYWIDVKFVGKKTSEEERLTTETQIGDEEVDEVAFGLSRDDDDGPLMDTDSEASDDDLGDCDASDASQSAKARSSSTKKANAKAKSKSKQKNNKEAVEEIPVEVGALK